MNVIAIAGASGFVGKYLQGYFQNYGEKVVVIPRDLLEDKRGLRELLSTVDVVINLAGENIGKRWTHAYKKKLYRSRIGTTRALVAAMNSNEKKQTLISTSAIGIYENDIVCDEEDFIYGQTFLTDLCKDWEKEAQKVQKRLVIFRFGLVLGEGGALHKMLPSFKLGLGGVVGDGTQSFSFIHIADLARAYAYVIYHDSMEGVYNLTTPYPVNNKIFTKELAKKLARPALIPVPSLAVKALLGEGAILLTQGQRVYPKRLMDNGFECKYKEISEVLEDILS